MWAALGALHVETLVEYRVRYVRESDVAAVEDHERVASVFHYDLGLGLPKRRSLGVKCLLGCFRMNMLFSSTSCKTK